MWGPHQIRALEVLWALQAHPSPSARADDSVKRHGSTPTVRARIALSGNDFALSSNFRAAVRVRKWLPGQSAN